MFMLAQLCRPSMLKGVGFLIPNACKSTEFFGIGPTQTVCSSCFSLAKPFQKNSSTDPNVITEYVVKWASLPYSDSTWETVSNVYLLHDAESAIARFGRVLYAAPSKVTALHLIDVFFHLIFSLFRRFLFQPTVHRFKPYRLPVKRFSKMCIACSNTR